LTFSQVIKLCDGDNKKRIFHKLLINEFKENEISLIAKNIENDESGKIFISPWTMPGYDFTNLINQFCIFNMIINGKKSKKNNNIKKILLAAGQSKRFGDKNKLSEIINGKPIINHILDTLFEIFDPSELIVIVGHEQNIIKNWWS